MSNQSNNKDKDIIIALCKSFINKDQDYINSTFGYTDLDDKYLSSIRVYNEAIKIISKEDDADKYLKIRDCDSEFIEFLKTALANLRNTLLHAHLRGIGNSKSNNVSYPVEAFKWEGNNDIKYNPNKQYLLLSN